MTFAKSVRELVCSDTDGGRKKGESHLLQCGEGVLRAASDLARVVGSVAQPKKKGGMVGALRGWIADAAKPASTALAKRADNLAGRRKEIDFARPQLVRLPRAFLWGAVGPFDPIMAEVQALVQREPDFADNWGQRLVAVVTGQPNQYLLAVFDHFVVVAAPTGKTLVYRVKCSEVEAMGRRGGEITLKLAGVREPLKFVAGEEKLARRVLELMESIQRFDKKFGWEPGKEE
jgi:hypothetical protein